MSAGKLGLKILILLTSHSHLGTTGHKTGVWMEELTTPYYAFKDAGADVTLASVDGGDVPVDPNSLNEADRPETVTRFLADKKAMTELEHSKKIQDLDIAPYAAVYLPGGHGVMWDLASDGATTKILSGAWASGKVLGAVCHGPAGLLGVTDTDGKPLLAGRQVSGFSNSEEEAAGLDHVVPFLLETRIRGLGAVYHKGPNFTPFAIRDGRLITGQNPQSSAKVAALILEATAEKR